MSDVFHSGSKFSTLDRDNDSVKAVNCAVTHPSAWWHGHSTEDKGCHQSNLNGKYLNGVHTSYADGVNWDAWKGHHESMKTTEMKFRPRI